MDHQSPATYVNILIVYDSLYGNTQKIARAIDKGFAPHAAQIVSIHDINERHFENIDLLVVGSPTHGGGASAPVKAFLKKMEKGKLSQIRAAAFDTSITPKGKNIFLRFILWIFGTACRRIARTLRKKGAEVIARQTFYVTGKEGPLLENEPARAENWGRSLIYP